MKLLLLNNPHLRSGSCSLSSHLTFSLRGLFFGTKTRKMFYKTARSKKSSFSTFLPFYCPLLKIPCRRELWSLSTGGNAAVLHHRTVVELWEGLLRWWGEGPYFRFYLAGGLNQNLVEDVKLGLRKVLYYYKFFRQQLFSIMYIIEVKKCDLRHNSTWHLKDTYSGGCHGCQQNAK